MRGRPTVLTAAVAASLLMVAGCESSSRSVTGPSGSKCALSIPDNLPPIPAAGGTGTLAVSAARECAWSAASAAHWITIVNGSGHGAGAITYSVAANPVPHARQGVVAVGELSATIVQSAAVCSLTLSPSSIDVGAGGGMARVTVGTIPGCSWSADADVDWIEVVDGSDEAGPGRVTLRIAPNDGAARTGTLAIARQSLTVRQDGTGPACGTRVSANDLSAPAGGASHTVTVMAAAGCGWTATSHDTWIVITDGARGAGNGIVSLTVDANSGGPRSGHVTIGSQTITVIQSAAVGGPGPGPGPGPEPGPGPTPGPEPGPEPDPEPKPGPGPGPGPGVDPHPPCTYTLNPVQQAVPLIPLSGYTVTVQTQAGCTWAVEGRSAWISINGSASGTGSGTVAYSVSIALLQRTGSIEIAGQTLTVEQGGQLLEAR